MTGRVEIDEGTEAVGKVVLDAAFTVHSALGPGLLESVYEACFEIELKKRGIAQERQKLLPLRYQGELVKAEMRLDLMIENKIVVEVKAVDNLSPIHTSQLLTYLKLSGCHLGYLVNFNVAHLRNGIKRVIG